MTGPMPARIIRVADGAAVGALVLAIFVALFGGFTLHLGPLPLRVHAPERLLFIALALAAIRHAAHPVDPLHRRLFRAVRNRPDGSARAIAPAAIGSRVAVLVVGYLAVSTIGVASISSGFQVSPRPLVNLPARFDAGWYSSTALDGYEFTGRWSEQQNVAFFPAFPMLMRAAGYPLGAFEPRVPRELRLARLIWGGVLISVAAFAWAAVYMWRLARDTIGEQRASAAVALMAAYPFAVFFSAPYSESLFLLGCLGAISHFRRQELGAAAAWGLLVGLTRPNGCFLSVVLAVLIVESRWSPQIARFPNSHISKFLLVASAPGVGMLAFSTYVYSLTGDFFGWARMHEAWGRSYEGLAPVTRGYGWLMDEGLVSVVQNAPYATLNSLGLIFALAMLWPVVRRLGAGYGVFILINVLPPLLAGGVLSMGRLTSTLFPMFLALAALVPARMVPPLVTAFALAQGLVAVLFFTWRPLY
jgi:hypothetical protein